ncbi:MAG: ATP-binding protein, partial [Clostridiales bacterium]|nr:ATP-binding protein [Clostridiales bacterium]
QYNSEAKNYFQSCDPGTIETLFKRISAERPNVKVVVVDTLNAIMIDGEIKRMKEKGYDKWIDMAISVYGLVDLAHSLRPGLFVAFTGHTQTDGDAALGEFTRMKTSGKKLDQICLESKFNVVLVAKAENGRHYFETKPRHTTARTPLGAVEEDEIDNDMKIVIEKLEGF